MKKNLEYSKSRHIFESTNKFKVMKKLSLILGIVLCTTLSYGQDVKVGYFTIKEYSNKKKDTLDIPWEIRVYKNDSVILYEEGVRTTYVIDSVVKPKESIGVDVLLLFATNKSDNQQYEIRIWENEKWVYEKQGYSHTVAFDNIKSGTFVNYFVWFKD